MRRNRFPNRYRLIPLFVGVALCCSWPARAQTKPAPKKSAPKKPAAPATIPLPLALGAGMGALILGAGLGMGLRKPTSQSQHSDAPDFFEAVPFPLALVDESEKISRRNPAFERFFASSTANFAEIFHPEDLKLARVGLRDVLDASQPDFSLSCRLFSGQGAPLHAVLSARKAGNARRGDPVLLAFRDTSAQAGAETELVGAREAISALYEVIAGDKTRDLDAKIRALLAMGCGRFELPYGVVGRLTSESFETLWVQSPHRRVRPAMTISRADTSPEAALLGLADLPTRSNWKSRPFVAKNDGAAYLGAPVLVENELFGMLSFSNLSAREKPWDNGEIELLQLMAEWVGSEIERENTRDSLEKQQKALLEANEKLEALATQDALTGAKNRRSFNEKIEEEWSRARRYSLPLSLVMLDVDKFKLFNDSFGHPAGDEVLKRVASVVMSAIRGTDFFARYGGEEFVLLLPNTDAEGAMILAQRLRQKIEETPWKERQITASLGVSSVSSQHKKAADLLQAADGALYHSKERGRNRVTHTGDLEPKTEEAAAPDAEFEAFG